MIGRVELVALEEAVHAAGEVIGTRSRNRLHLQSDRSTLGHIEQVREDLKLGDGFPAEACLPEKGRLGDGLSHLLSVEVELELVFAGRSRSRADAGVVAGHPLDQQGEFHPVAPGNRQLFHLSPVDVAGDLR